MLQLPSTRHSTPSDRDAGAMLPIGRPASRIAGVIGFGSVTYTCPPLATGRPVGADGFFAARGGFFAATRDLGRKRFLERADEDVAVEWLAEEASDAGSTCLLARSLVDEGRDEDDGNRRRAEQPVRQRDPRHAARHVHVADDASAQGEVVRLEKGFRAVEGRHPVAQAADESVERHADALVVVDDGDERFRGQGRHLSSADVGPRPIGLGDTVGVRDEIIPGDEAGRSVFALGTMPTGAARRESDAEGRARWEIGDE